MTTIDRRKPYHFEIPLPNGGKCVSNGMDTIELCVAEFAKSSLEG